MKTEMHIVHVPWPVTCRWWWWSSADGRFFSHPLCADEEIMLKLFIFLIYFHFLTLRLPSYASPTSMLKLALPLSPSPSMIFQHHCCKWNVLVKFWKNRDNSLKSGFFRCCRKKPQIRNRKFGELKFKWWGVIFWFWFKCGRSWKAGRMLWQWQQLLLNANDNNTRWVFANLFWHLYRISRSSCMHSLLKHAPYFPHCVCSFFTSASEQC